MDRSALEAEAGRLLNDPNHDTWSTSVIDARLDLAQTEVNGYANAVKTKETLTPTANTSEVAVSALTIDIVRARYTLPSGEKFPLEGITRDELDFRYPNWENWSPGKPMAYTFDASNRNLILVPAPDAAHAIASALDVWEVRQPASLSSSTSVPFDDVALMVPYHMAIVHWAVAQCWMDRGDPESLAKAKFHKSGVLSGPNAGQYENQLMRIIEKFDRPEDIPIRINWKPQGGRLGGWGTRSKSSPLG
jgi:hypothetical protein